MRTRRLTVALVALTAQLPAGHAAALQPGGSSPGVTTTADMLRAAGRHGSLAGVLATAAEVVTHDAISPLPDALALRIDAAGLSPALRSAVGGLVAATLHASREVHASVRERDRATVLARMRGLLSGRARAIEPGPPLRISPRYEHLATLIDRPRMERAATEMARAVDALVSVRGTVVRGTVAPARRDSVHAAGECDVLDAAPYLCIGGASANTYATHHWVSIDLGGDDLYTGPAGAAGPCASFGCARVAVDLGGDDVYDSSVPSADCYPTVCAQGSGMYGIGMLVDAEGSDRYTASGRPFSSGCGYTAGRCAVLFAQGTGNFGVGVLADLGGSDEYRVAAPARGDGDIGDIATSVYGQAANQFGFGLLWDAGIGDDTYLATAYATGAIAENLSSSGTSFLLAQGGTAGSSAFLLDGGGRDAFRVRVTASPSSVASKPSAPLGEGAGASVGGQGIDYFGSTNSNTVGALITGEGDTTYSVEAEGKTFVIVNAQSAGTQRALLDDAGGDDTYLARVTADTSIASSCACPAVALEVSPIAYPYVYLAAQGHGGLASVGGATTGMLRDRGGNDTYDSVFRSSLRVAATNTERGGTARAISRKPGVRLVCAQGCGSSLLDEGGDDRYRIDAANLVAATAVVVTDPAAATAIAHPGPLYLRGQGHTGSLSDVGGTDMYEVAQRNDGAADPDPGGHSIGGEFASAVQATANTYVDRGGVLSDRDDGEPDRFSAESPTVFNVCHGRYGDAPGWIGGGEDYFGVAGIEDGCVPGNGAVDAGSTAEMGAQPLLSVVSTTSVPGADPPAVTVTVRLVDAAGAPLAGRRVVTVPLYRENGRVGSYWRNGDGISAEMVTGSDGTAHAIVAVFTPARVFRVDAMFFGERGTQRPAVAHGSSI